MIPKKIISNTIDTDAKENNYFILNVHDTYKHLLDSCTFIRPP